MESKSNAKAPKGRKAKPMVLPVMSMSEFAKLGGGKVAYIRVMTADEAKEMFPAVEGIPTGISSMPLHAADGTPIALTDSRQSAPFTPWRDELRSRARIEASTRDATTNVDWQFTVLRRRGPQGRAFCVGDLLLRSAPY